MVIDIKCKCDDVNYEIVSQFRKIFLLTFLSKCGVSCITWMTFPLEDMNWGLSTVTPKGQDNNFDVKVALRGAQSVGYAADGLVEDKTADLLASFDWWTIFSTDVVQLFFAGGGPSFLSHGASRWEDSNFGGFGAWKIVITAQCNQRISQHWVCDSNYENQIGPAKTTATVEGGAPAVTVDRLTRNDGHALMVIAMRCSNSSSSDRPGDHHWH